MQDRLSNPTNIKAVADIGCIEVVKVILYQLSLLMVGMVDCDTIKMVYMRGISRDRFEDTLIEANLKRIRASLNVMLAIVYGLPSTLKDVTDFGRLEAIEPMLYQLSLVMIMRFDKEWTNLNREDRRNKMGMIPVLAEDTVVEANLKRIKTSLSIILSIVGKLLE